MKQVSPSLNSKIKEVIVAVDGGNVARFSKRLAGISQQRLNRIFNPDNRTGKYPSVPDDVLVSIAKSIPNISMDWLLADKGDMLKVEVEQHQENASKSVAIGRDANGSKINIDSQENTDNLVKIVEKYQMQIDRLLAIIEKLTDKPIK
jgi:hypothetical protein